MEHIDAGRMRWSPLPDNPVQWAATAVVAVVSALLIGPVLPWQAALVVAPAIVYAGLLAFRGAVIGFASAEAATGREA